MENILEKLFYNSINEIIHSVPMNNLEAEIGMNKKRLKEKLSKNQKKLLLRIEDTKDLMREKSNLKSFIVGFKLGLKIGYETNKD